MIFKNIYFIYFWLKLSMNRKFAQMDFEFKGGKYLTIFKVHIIWNTCRNCANEFNSWRLLWEH